MQFDQLKRRDFITLLAWRHTARGREVLAFAFEASLMAEQAQQTRDAHDR